MWVKFTPRVCYKKGGVGDVGPNWLHVGLPPIQFRQKRSVHYWYDFTSLWTLVRTLKLSAYINQQSEPNGQLSYAMYTGIVPGRESAHCVSHSCAHHTSTTAQQEVRNRPPPPPHTHSHFTRCECHSQGSLRFLQAEDEGVLVNRITILSWDEGTLEYRTTDTW